MTTHRINWFNRPPERPTDGTVYVRPESEHSGPCDDLAQCENCYTAACLTELDQLRALVAPVAQAWRALEPTYPGVAGDGDLLIALDALERAWPR